MSDEFSNGNTTRFRKITKNEREILSSSNFIPSAHFALGNGDWILLTKTVNCAINETPNTIIINGAVPKWLRERSAKPLFDGSNPSRASQNFLESPDEIGGKLDSAFSGGLQ